MRRELANEVEINALDEEVQIRMKSNDLEMVFSVNADEMEDVVKMLSDAIEEAKKSKYYKKQYKRQSLCRNTWTLLFILAKITMRIIEEYLNVVV